MTWRLAIAPLVVACAAYVAAEVVVTRRAVPPDEAKTFAGWLAWQPDAHRFMIARDDKHLMAIGRNGVLFPSGPSVYVFDAQSRLADWTGDLGDDPNFERKWSIQYPLSFVDRAEAEKWIK